MDSFSRLSDDLLLQILSFLPMEESVRTSVLSTRWRYLYTSTPRFKFHLDVKSREKAHQIGLMVDRLFFYRKRCIFDEFLLSWRLPIDLLRLHSWMNTVLLHGIREFDISIENIEFKPLPLPTALFTCETLVVLKLKIYSQHFLDSRLKLPAKVFLPNLKVLRLGRIVFEDNSWDYLFSNCPALEELYFRFIEGDCKFSVFHLTLKSLTIESYLRNPREDGFEIIINAPSLVYLEYNVSNVTSHKFANVQSLVEANIVFNLIGDNDKGYTSAATDLMRGISNIQKLRLSVVTFQCLYEHNVPFPVLHNLTHLTVYDCEGAFTDLPPLIACCESLETLVLEDYCYCVPAWSSREWMECRISCLSSCLKRIEIHEFGGEEDEMKMVMYFLKHARVLESIELHIGAEYEKNRLDITKMLHELARVSEDCILTVV